MDLTQHVEAVQRQLAVAAEAGGDEARALAERLTPTLDSVVRLTLLEVLGAAAAEITRELAPGSVDLRLRGREPEFVVSQPIYAGEQVSRQRFSSSTEIGVRSSLTGNMRAVALAGDGVQLLADTLRAGDRVDLVGSLKISEDKDISATRIVLRDLEVLKPAGSTGNKRLDNAAGRNQLSVLLAVSDTQVQKLFHVQRHGEWTLQLRPVVDAVDSPESMETNLTILRDGLRGGQGGN